MYLRDEIDRVQTTRRFGRVAAINGLLVELSGAEFGPGIGSRVRIRVAGGETVMAEVVGFREDRVLCMPFAELVGVAPGARADLEEGAPALYPATGWIGRIVNAFGEPIDGAGPLVKGADAYPYRSSPPAAHLRKRVGPKIDLGVRSLNTFASCCRGQRLGIFAGSGVGKSVLLSMLARYTEADAIVIGLIGERGREVREFIQDDLGPDGLARSIVVVATSDETALARRHAAYTTLALAEYLRDQGQHVLCLIDSITRFAMAQREIGLSAGEPPTTKGYTPTVFAELPKLLERAGPGAEGSGDITGLFTVLVDGDDHNEPIADAVRGILDGHIVMERKIAERGRYPAINVLKSVSRTMPGCNTPEQQAVVREAKAHMSTYEDMADLIRLGAYRAGSNAEVDRAIELNPSLEAFLTQIKTERTSLSEGYRKLGEILGHVEAPPPAPASAPARRRR